MSKSHDSMRKESYTEEKSWSKSSQSKNQVVRPKQHTDRTNLSPMIRVKSIYPGYKHWVRFYRGHVYKTGENGDDIYHWQLDSHNFFEMEENRRSSRESRIYLAFTDPEFEVIQLDKYPKYAYDTDVNSKVNIRPILIFAKWNGIKFKPNSFIARNYKQIEEALSHISYCMIESFSEEPDTAGMGGIAIPVTSHNKSYSHSNSPGESLDDETLSRSLRIVYPSEPPVTNIHDEVTQQRSSKLDIMATSPLGCLESPN